MQTILLKSVVLLFLYMIVSSNQWDLIIKLQKHDASLSSDDLNDAKKQL